MLGRLKNVWFDLVDPLYEEIKEIDRVVYPEDLVYVEVQGQTYCVPDSIKEQPIGENTRADLRQAIEIARTMESTRTVESYTVYKYRLVKVKRNTVDKLPYKHYYKLRGKK